MARPATATSSGRASSSAFILPLPQTPLGYLPNGQVFDPRSFGCRIIWGGLFYRFETLARRSVAEPHVVEKTAFAREVVQSAEDLLLHQP